MEMSYLVHPCPQNHEYCSLQAERARMVPSIQEQKTQMPVGDEG